MPDPRKKSDPKPEKPPVISAVADNTKDLDSASILAAEYNYIAQTAFQANEDRARVTQLFLITFGTLIAALYSTQLQNVDLALLYHAFAFVFLILFVFGMLTVMQLVRLRLAWRESVLAMNHIKAEVIRRDPALKSAFRWSVENTPKAFKLNSIGFILASMVGLLSGVSMGLAVVFYLLGQGSAGVQWLPGLAAGLVSGILLLVLFYWLPLKKEAS
jgi:hypothetical protein